MQLAAFRVFSQELKFVKLNRVSEIYFHGLDSNSEHQLIVAIAWKAGDMLLIEEVIVVPPKPHEFRIKIICTSLCDSDITFWKLEIVNEAELYRSGNVFYCGVTVKTVANNGFTEHAPKVLDEISHRKLDQTLFHPPLGADIQEVIGSGIALKILTIEFLPLWASVLITSFDCFIFLFLENYGVRKLEALFAVLIAVISLRYVALNMPMKAVSVDDQAVQTHCATILECVKVGMKLSRSILK
ncbi:hypothetical protein L2E82_07832 [Cichorium intybus]|uniref:Uncharacterized protein n=1 Tax=Cichorium intybus TaxID=13427 RepID=A0ACB9G607_CICIN|nr:hypothetical protein L2E82_07832 [Cichorium intybus]